LAFIDGLPEQVLDDLPEPVFDGSGVPLVLLAEEEPDELRVGHPPLLHQVTEYKLYTNRAHRFLPPVAGVFN